MEIIKLTTRLTSEEKETLLSYDYLSKMWHMESTVQKHYNKALRQGWTPLIKYVYEDGTIAGYALEAPDRAITIRNVEAKKMSDKQMINLNGDE